MSISDEEAIALFESGEGFNYGNSEYTPLGYICLARWAREAVDEQLTEAVREGRKAGLSWYAVGLGTGLSASAARRKYKES